MTRLFPHPFLTLILIVVWCLLSQAFTLGTVVFGTILGIILPFVTAAFWPDRPKISNPFKLLVYVVIVIYDIIVANVVVAAIILFKSNAARRPAWVPIPLELKSPEAITVLAGTITLTPGTVSVDLSEDGRSLLVHALDAPDPDGVRDDIKSRYESRLKEIFE